MKQRQDTKALDGSFEDRRNRLSEALVEAAILPAGDTYVTDTFADKAVVCVWSRGGEGEGDEYEYKQAYYEVEISAETPDGFEFGQIREVDKVFTESLVPVEKGAGGGRHKSRVRFTLKALSTVDDDVGGWDAEGVFSVFDYEDHSRDIVRKGATELSISQHMPKILDHHGVTVGQGTAAEERDGGLWVKFRIYPTRAGEDLAKLMRPIDTDLGPHAPVEQGSIGFSPLEGGAKRRSGGGWEYTKLWIWEVSPVTFGDNDQTVARLAKSMAWDADGQAPTGDLLEQALDGIRVAVEGPQGIKALYFRRLGEGRGLTDAQWKAAGSLAVGLSDALMSTLELHDRAGKSLGSAQLRYIGAILDSLVTILHGRESLPEPEPEVEVEQEKPGAGGSKGRPGDNAQPTGTRDTSTVLAALGLAGEYMETST